MHDELMNSTEINKRQGYCDSIVKRKEHLNKDWWRQFNPENLILVFNQILNVK